jgi:hypothetical protein
MGETQSFWLSAGYFRPTPTGRHSQRLTACRKWVMNGHQAFSMHSAYICFEECLSQIGSTFVPPTLAAHFSGIDITHRGPLDIPHKQGWRR